MTRPRLSIVMIVHNEAELIGETLASVAWADEIIVVDSGSTDRTVEICREFGARVEIADWPGFGPQKNRALVLATGEWVLSLDADERVTPELRAEIEAVLVMNDPAVAAYDLPRLSSYCGRFMRHGGWWPDRICRLFRRERARFSDDRVHERVIVDGPVGHLESHLVHLSFRSLEQVLAKVNGYSSEGAQMLRTRGKCGGLGKALGHGLWTFIRTYFLKRGFLDGREGFMLAVSNAEGTYYRYLKLMLLDRQAEGDR